MKISELSAKTDLSIDTLRFYEKIGLIDPPPRDPAGRRDYDPSVIDWLAFLAQLNATGMKQADRIHYAALRRQGPATYPERRKMLEDHRTALRAQMRNLRATIDLMDRKVALYRKLEQEAETDVRCADQGARADRKDEPRAGGDPGREV